jgi:uncharacterized protein YndB with AHSA1/START domain
MLWLILLWFAAGLVGLFAAMFAVGLALPLKHSASRSTRFACPPQVAFDAISDWKRFPEWRSGVKSVEERLHSASISSGWIENTSHGRIPLEVIELDSQHRLVTRIADPNLPFGGTWTWTIKSLDDGRSCEMTIREDGETRNAMFRFMARFIFGYNSTMDAYLKDLDKKLGAAASAAAPASG